MHKRGERKWEIKEFYSYCYFVVAFPLSFAKMWLSASIVVLFSFLYYLLSQRRGLGCVFIGNATNKNIGGKREERRENVP